MLVGFLLTGSAILRADSTYFFSPEVEITEATANGGSSLTFQSSGQHFTAFRGDTVYVVWEETRFSPPPVGTWVFFAKSTDGGITFGPNKAVAGGVTPSMRVDSSGIIHLAYQSGGDIFFRKSTDGGATFSSRVKVSDDTIAQMGQERPAIEVNNRGQIFIAWRDQRNMPPPTARNLFSAASFDGGTSFTSNVQVNEAGTYVNGGIDIATDDSGRVYAAYKGTTTEGKNGIVLNRSVDSGLNYNYHLLASDLPIGQGLTFAEDPSITVSSNALVGVAWQDGRFDQWTLRFSASQDYGQTFSPSVRVEDDSDLAGTSSPYFPSLSWKNGSFYVSWNENRPRSPNSIEVYDIFFSYSSDSGKTFKPSFRVTNDSFIFSDVPIDHVAASIAVNDEGKAFVAWLDDRHDPFFEENWHIFGAVGSSRLIKGDVNLDWRLTAADAVTELNAVFLGEVFPAPFQNADGNCDGLLTAADVILLLNAIFLGIPFPCP